MTLLMFGCRTETESNTQNEEPSKTTQIVQIDNSEEAVLKWNEGGTLHRATIADWKIATEENKLATCADMVVAMDKNVASADLLGKAHGLKTCIEEATIGIEEVENEKVASIASMCTVLMNQ
ncbi:MAG TPA: hypothetical protein VF676_06965 [Flavobacterium sp.]